MRLRDFRALRIGNNWVPTNSHRFHGFLWILITLGLWMSLPAWGHGTLHDEIARLDAELIRKPGDAELLIERGEMYRIHELFPQAKEDWQKVAQLRPTDPTNHLRLGLIALGSRETNSAVELLKRFVQECPQCLPGQLSMATAYQMAGQNQEAVQHWTRAIQLVPEPNPEWYLQRARAGVAGKMPVESVLSGLDEAIGQYGPLPPLQLMAVDLEVSRGKVDAALDRISAIAKRADRKERWIVRRAEILMQAGRFPEAKTEFIAAREAIDRLPEKLRRAWVATDLRQQIEAKLATLEQASASAPQKP